VLTLLWGRVVLAQEKPMVAVSVPPQQYFVARIAGERVAVASLIPAGANPHIHEPSMKQVKLLERAAVYLVVGSPLLPLEEMWRKGAPKHLRVVDTARGCNLQRELDAHLWVSPRCVGLMAEVIAEELKTLLPGDAEEIQSNLLQFQGEIAQLQAEIQERLRPSAGKAFFVYHPAWGYFASEFGLEQVAIEAEGKEPDARQLASVIKRAREEGVKAIFVEPQFSKQSAKVVAREIGAEVVTVDPQAMNWSENLREFSQLLQRELR
jgi:zinc transport system substrate-binding protein